MLLDLINYTAVADKLIINGLQDAKTPLQDAEALFSHVLNAQFIWIKRIKKEPADRDRFDLHPISELDDLHVQNIKDLLEIYHTQGLEEQVIYQNSSGESFLNVVKDILFHVETIPLTTGRRSRACLKQAGLFHRLQIIFS